MGALKKRIEELAAKSTKGELIDEERGEYEGYVRANKFVAVLRRLALDAKAQTNDVIAAVPGFFGVERLRVERFSQT